MRLWPANLGRVYEFGAKTKPGEDSNALQGIQIPSTNASLGRQSDVTSTKLVILLMIFGNHLGGVDMDSQEKFDNERFDALMKLADFRFQRWQVRRATDWQLSLALWTLLVVATGYIVIHKGEFSWSARLGLAFGLIVLVIGHAL
jgi:hypothetical protein